MKELWIEIDESISNELKNNLLKSAAQICDAVLVGSEDVEKAKKTGAKTAASSGECDINVLEVFDENKINELKDVGRTIAVKVTIKGKEDQETAIEAAELSSDYIIIHCTDWKVIPLENLIAKTRGKSKLLAEVSSAKEAKLALETLELGADGVVLKTSNPDELMETAVIAKKKAPKVELVPAEVVELKEIGTGARVCVDTCDLMKPGEGILVGCQSSGLFLVQAEVHESPYVETRPFRVNAGPISLYTLSSPTRTRYLSELKAGDEVLIVDREGKVRSTNVARVKIEWRPMMLVEAEYGGKRIKTIVQNAETIRLVTEEGSKSVAKLKRGDKLLAHVVEGGRHFGTLVKEETVIER
ncbi:MAG: 3-dehydroquinate synthase [Candidatus Bathyarchaeota archaeon BA2]|nr:MAG: 3-dehydroquinate synthase [Candidatus Bathyarchaeota archaeon BA2]